MLAAFKIRAVPVNVNYRYVEEELRYLFDDADAKAVIFHREFAPKLAAIRDRLAAAHALRQRRGRLRTRTSAALGATDYDDALAAGAPRPGLRRPLGRRPLRPLHRRHHRACPRA